MIVIEDGETSFGAYISDLLGHVAVAETESEVKRLIEEAIGFHLEDLRDSGAEIPKSLSKSEYV